MKLRNKKTGEVVDFKIIADYDDCTSGWRLEKQDGSVLFYDHIDEIHEDWEDYEPKEPLIKDEKIRKAVRAWAEVNELGPDYEVKYDADMYGLNSWQADINFNYRIDGLKHNKKYTIAELCGGNNESL